jgi:hypothetical protein
MSDEQTLDEQLSDEQVSDDEVSWNHSMSGNSIEHKILNSSIFLIIF